MTAATLTNNQSITEKVATQPLLSSWAIAAEQQKAATAARICQAVSEAKVTATSAYEESAAQAKLSWERSAGHAAMMLPLIAFLLLVASCYHVNLMGLLHEAPMIALGILSYVIVSAVTAGNRRTATSDAE